ncbi:hypothetical protein ACET3Z_031230 [Daucus carota]
MALNQIHYGSLKSGTSGKGKRYKASTRSPGAPARQHSLSQSQIARDFILGFQHLIEPSVFVDAMANNEKALSLALGQIHHKTLPETTAPNKSFRDTLLSNPVRQSPSPPKGAKPRLQIGDNQPKGPISIFFTGFDESVRAASLWQLFKQAGAVQDIILPKRRDKFGNRIGFIVAKNGGEATKIISKLNGHCMGKSTLYLALAKNPNKSSPQVSHHRVSQPIAPHTRPKECASLNASNCGNNHRKDSQDKNPESASIRPNERITEDVYPSKTDFANTTSGSTILPHDAALQEELECCVLLVTAKKETVSNVEMIVAGLGFREVIIRGLSSFKFMAYFTDVACLEELDLDFLHVGFMEVSKIREEDLVVPRQAWVEIRGLPLHRWTEANYSLLMKPWGDIIHFGRTLDEDDFYVTPKLLIETAQLGNIEATKQVVLLGKRWQLQITETFGVGSELQQLTDKVPAQENDINDPFITTGQGEADFPPPYPSVVENVVVEESHNSDRDIHTAHWKPRDRDSSPSFPHSKSNDGEPIVDDDSDTGVSDTLTVSSSVLKELRNLKVQVRRGRPRKYKQPQVNKHFKVPRRKKMRGEGLQQVSHFFLNADYDEAEAIYEKGIMMALTEEQAIVTRIQAACEHALSVGWDKTHIETVSPRVYDTISLHEHIILNDDQLEVYRNLNTLFANNFKERITKRNVACIPCIPQSMNSTVAYYLARDMGRALIPSYVAGNQIPGDGEVIDGPPPPPLKKRKISFPTRLAVHADEPADKGKANVLSSYSFNDDGALNQKAVQLLAEGKLNC